MSSGARTAAVVAGVLAGLGAAFAFGVYAGKRRRARELGFHTGTVTAGGMTLRKYYDKQHIPIDVRLRILQDMIAKSVEDPRMRKLALSITRKCPARDGKCEARAIYDWIRENIRYTGDIAPHKLGADGPYEAVDFFQSAARTVEFGGGDCDDHTILGATLAIHNGIQAKLRVTSRTKKRAEDYTHIYPALGLPKMRPKSWVAIDTTLPGNYFGVEAPHKKRLDRHLPQGLLAA